MSITELGALGEFVGSIAVLGTLIYLAIQTRLTKEATQEMYMLNRIDQRIRGMWADRDSPYVATLFGKASRGEPLEVEDEFRLTNSLFVEIVVCFVPGLHGASTAATSIAFAYSGRPCAPPS